MYAQSAIGQGTVAVTPLAMAMVAQAVANGGVMMTPHVLGHVENNDGEAIRGTQFDTSAYKTSARPETAATLRDLMVDVVNDGHRNARAAPRHPGGGQDRHRAGRRIDPRTRGSSGSRRPKHRGTRSRCSSRTAAHRRAATTQPEVALPRRSRHRCSVHCCSQ